MKNICKDYRKLSLSINKYNSEGINYPSEKDD